MFGLASAYATEALCQGVVRTARFCLVSLALMWCMQCRDVDQGKARVFTTNRVLVESIQDLCQKLGQPDPWPELPRIVNVPVDRHNQAFTSGSAQAIGQILRGPTAAPETLDKADAEEEKEEDADAVRELEDHWDEVRDVSLAG
jgi:hypothetical protein